MTLQERLGKRCSALKSGDIVMNKDYYGKTYKKPLVIGPSRSGSTSETLMALEFFRNNYAKERYMSVIHNTDQNRVFISDETEKKLIEVISKKGYTVCHV